MTAFLATRSVPGARTVLATAALLAFHVSSYSGGVVWRAEFLGNPTGLGNNAESRALAINNAGQVVGWYQMPDAERKAVLFSGGVMFDLGVAASGAPSRAMAISDPQGVAGRYAIVGDDTQRNGRPGTSGFIQSRSSVNALSVTTMPINAVEDGAIQLRGVNAAGLVVGSLISATGAESAFVRDTAGRLLALKLAGGHSRANAINNAGQIAGAARVADGRIQAVIFEGGGVREIGGLRGGFAEATAINAKGWVAGNSQIGTAGEAHAFAFVDGVINRLVGSAAAGEQSWVMGINLGGQVVGARTTAEDAVPSPLWSAEGFIYSSSGGYAELRSHVVGLEGTGTLLGRANGINDLGQIVAGAGGGLGVLLTPEGTLSWAQPLGGRVSNAGNWDSGLGFTPNRLLDVVIAPGNGQFVQADVAFSARSLRVGGATAGSNGRVNFVLSPGMTVNAGSGLSIASSGTLRGEGRVIGTVVNRGTVLAEGVMTLDGGLDNRGLVTGTGRIEANLINRSTGGGVRVGAGQNLTLAGTVHSAADGSHITIQDGGRLAFEGRFVNQGGAFLDIERGTLQVGYGTQRMDNGGLVRVGSGRAEILGDVNNSPRGLIHAHDGADLTVWDALRNDGELRVSGGSTIVYAGPVSGKGGFTGLDGMHRFEGGYSPGNSPAAVQMGNVQIASLLTMELGGLAAGSQYDHIDFVGSVLFEATSFLKISLINGFTPHAGDHFALFSYAQTPVGNFEDFYLPSLSAGLNWDVSQLHTTGNLLVSGVPEPQSWALMLVGLLGVFSIRSRCLRSAFFDTQLESPTMKFSPAMLGAGLLTALVATMPAQAAPVSGRGDWETTLSGRDLDGNLGNGFEAYYDTSLNITWLATAQAPGGNLGWVAANA